LSQQRLAKVEAERDNALAELENERARVRTLQAQLAAVSSLEHRPYLEGYPKDEDPLCHTYKLGTSLGFGSFGEVYAATLYPHEQLSPSHRQHRALKAARHGGHHDVWHDESFALKFIDIEDVSTATQSAMESLRLVRCEHPNIVGLRELFFHSRDSELTASERSWKSPLQLCMVLERCHGDLRDTLRQWAEQDVGQATKLALFSQMCSAVQHMHGRGLIHRDLKPDNIFLHNNGSVKVGDLGLATREESEKDHEQEGTPGYIAPEWWKCIAERFVGIADYNHAVDVWALGQILVDMSCASLFVASDGGSAAYHLLVQVDEVLTVDGEEEDGGDSGDSAFAFMRAEEAALAAVLEADSVKACRQTSTILRQCLVVDPQRRCDSCKKLEHLAAPSQ